MLDSRPSHAVRGAAKIAAASYLANLAGIASGIVVPRFLGKEAYGEYAFLAAAFSMAVGLSELGLGLVITRHFAPLYDSGEHEKATGLYKAIFISRFISGFIASVGCFIFLELSNPFQSPLAASIIILFLVLLLNVTDSLFRLQLGAQRYGYWGLIFPMRSFTRLLLVVPGFLIAGIPGAVGGLLLGECFISMMGFRLSRSVIPHWKVKADFKTLLSHTSLAGLNYTNQLIGVLERYIGVMMVAFITFSADMTGYYYLAMRLVLLLFSAPMQSFNSLTPTLSILHEQRDTERLSAWIGLAARCGILAFIMIWGVFSLVGRSAISFVLGESFEPVYSLLFILLLSSPFQWLGTIFYQVCNVYRRPGLNIPAGVVRIIIFVLLGIWFLELWDVTGLAAAYSISFVLSCGVTYLLVWLILGMRISPMRFIILLLCALPYIGGLLWAEGLWERLAAALTASAIALAVAHITGALRINDLSNLYRSLKGDGIK